MSTFVRALRVLDQVQSLAQVEALDVALFAGAVGDQTAPVGQSLDDLSRQLDDLAALRDQVDRFAQKSMRIRVTASSDPLTPQLRTLVASTITAYEHDLPLLRTRMAGAVARVAGSNGAEVTERLVEAARRVLATRAELLAIVAAASQAVALAWLPVVRRGAADRLLPVEEREGWRRALVDVEALAGPGAPAEPEPPDESDASEDAVSKRFSLLDLD